ncbi:MAG: hypothetical protein WKG01_27590 [Kofleriaceae bacterium]
MKRAVFPLLAAAAGCTHNRTPVDIQQVIGKQVTVVTLDRNTATAYGDHVAAGIVFRDPSGRVIPNEHIDHVIKVSHRRGALEGLGLGLAIGAGFGAVLGLASGDDQCERECYIAFTAGEKAVVGAIVFGTLGSGIGLIVGAIRGSRSVYSFGRGHELHITPSGPPGSVVGATLAF